MRGNKQLNIPAAETIRRRSSVRSYQPVQLPSSLLAELEDYASSLEGPFSPRVRPVFLEDSSFREKSGRKIGTYGIIKGAKHYIAGVVEKGDYDLEQFGFVFEHLILYATFLGLGTCWLGGTFKHTEFVKAVGLESSEILPVVTPVGYPAGKKRLLEKAMKFASGSKKRKPWEQLFFHRSFDYPLEEGEAGPFAEPLEMVRLAPSASNHQPWRIVKDESSWHFFMNYSPLVNKAVGFDIQRVDMGIAMCHFDMLAQEQGFKGRWVADKNSAPTSGAHNLYYVISWHWI